MYIICSKCLHFRYALFTYVYYRLDGHGFDGEPYIYSYLNWGENISLALESSIGALVMSILMFLILFGLYKLKIRVSKKCFPEEE